MAIYLDENRVGSDAGEIGYPHLLLCMGVTVLMDDGSLIGAHVSEGTSEGIVLGEMAVQIGNHGGAMQRLYCTGDRHEHTLHGGGTVAQKAAAINFHGDAYLFDAGSIKPTQGTFVTVRSNGPDKKCGVYYKRDQKVHYDSTGNGPNVSSYRMFSGLIRVEPSVVTGFTQPTHKLHKASHLLQMKHYDIP